MGSNQNGKHTDIAVESIAEINQKVEEEKLKSSLHLYEKEMEHLSNLSERLIISRKDPTCLNFKMEGNTIFQIVDGVLLLVIYHPEKNSCKIIETCEEALELDVCYASKENENEFFLYKKNFFGFKHFSMKSVNKSVLSILSFGNLLKETRAFCSSVTYHKSTFNHSFTEVNDILELKQHGNNLIVSSISGVFVINLDNYDVIHKYLHILKYDTFITNNYVSVKREGFCPFYPDQFTGFVKNSSLELISKDERLFLTFDAEKWVGKIYPMTLGRKELTKSESEKFDSSFSLMDTVLSFDFSDDSEFLFILSKSDFNGNLNAFSIREKKFVSNMKLNPYVRQIYVQNNHVICCTYKNVVIEILEICIPKKLKPYLLTQNNLDLFFKFQ
jgi:hypothetical protein